jgi:predicted MPP superfamily phosphohydrolase
LLGDTVRTLRGMAKGFKRGNLFPAAGRPLPREAPGGTTVEERENFVLRRHRVPVKGLSEPLTVLQISDAHVRHPTRPFERLCNEMTELRADVVALTGDFIAREWRITAVHHFFAHVPRGRLGTFAVIGNWERWAGWDEPRLRPALAQHKIRLLLDEAVDLGPAGLVGTDDATSGSPDLDKAFGAAPAGKPAIVLTHSPRIFPDVAARKPGFVMAGHSHGGQVRIPGLGAAWIPRGTDQWVAGFYEEGGSPFYVSNGLGWSMAPLRIGVPAEIALHELVPGDAR